MATDLRSHTRSYFSPQRTGDLNLDRNLDAIAEAFRSLTRDALQAINALLPRDAEYASFYEYDNLTGQAIVTALVPHPIWPGIVVGPCTAGWSYVPGRGNSYASIADLGSNRARVTCAAAHRLQNGQIVAFTSSTVAAWLAQTATATANENYYKVDGVTATTFDVSYSGAFPGNASGLWVRGTVLVPGETAGGIYLLSWNASTLVAAGGAATKMIKFEARAGVLPITTAVAQGEIAAAGMQPMAAAGIVTLAAGDAVGLSVENQADGNDVTIGQCNLTLTRLWY